MKAFALRPTLTGLLAGVCLLSAVSVSSLALAADKEVTIAYQDMMVPWRYAQQLDEAAKETGYKVNYRKFGGGGDVIRAMASGNVQIGEAGSSPVAAGLSLRGALSECLWSGRSALPVAAADGRILGRVTRAAIEQAGADPG